MARIEDIAKKAKVSVTTVSRALNNHPYVSEKTKKKIYQAMEELNYYPNRMAQQLRAQKTNLIGVIISYITNQYFAYLIDAIEETALEQDYNLVILQTHGNAVLEQFYFSMIQKKQLDGIIATTLETVTPNVLRLINEGKVVVCNRYIGDKTIPVIKIDEEQASYQGTQFLIQKGHSKIAFCTGNIKNDRDQRFKGFLRAHQENHLTFDEHLFFENILTVGDGRTFVQKIITSDNIKPTAVFSNGDEVAAGIISEAQKYNINVPNQLAVLGFDDQPIASLMSPNITTIQQPIQLMGKMAAESLIVALENHEQIHKTNVLKTKLIIRESV